MDKTNHVSKCKPVYSKNMTYYPIIIRLASLHPDSGVYTLSHEISWAVKFARRLDVTMEFN